MSKFQFIHTYLPGTFEGLEKSGLWRECDGLKIMHKNYFSPDRQFNEICAPGSPLFRLLEERRCVFYVDRYQGGIAMPYAYDYDPAKVQALAELLGDNFWGFQMHEWASNYRSESFRVKEAIEKYRAEKPDAPMADFWAEKTEAVKTNCMALFTEAHSVEEWSHMQYPETPAAFMEGVKKLWHKRADTLRAPLLPADSFFMSHKITIAGGAKRLLPEIGWQIPHMRWQIPYTRGMARAAGIPFGVYYESWCSEQGRELTIPYTVDTYRNEWYEDDLLESVRKRTDGKPENGGSSRSLQERAWVYSYFAGASAMGEEYGICNTFTDYKDFALSAYGQVKKNFLDFTERFPDLGTPYVPFAIVLPADYELLTLGDREDEYLHYPLSLYDTAYAEKVRLVKKTLETLLTDKDSGITRMGNDPHVLQNGKYPDVFDIIHADMPAAIEKYPFLIDATGDPAFRAKYGDRIVPLSRVQTVLSMVMPATVGGNLQYAVNRDQNGWLLMILNNNGVDRTPAEGDVQLPAARTTAQIMPGTMNCIRPEKLAGSGRLHTDGGSASVTLGAGEWILVRI